MNALDLPDFSNLNFDVQRERLIVENSVLYRPGVETLLLQGKWNFNVRTSQSFRRPVAYFLERLENGTFVRLDLTVRVQGRKRCANQAGPLFDLNKLNGDGGNCYILPISFIKEGTTAPFPCTSFTKRPSPKSPAPEVDVFRIVAENSEGETLESAYLIICNNNIKDLASMHPFDRDRIEAALENLVYDATNAWKLLEDLPISKEEIPAWFRFKEDRLNTNLEDDVLKLFCHCGLEKAVEDSVLFKFGEMHGGEQVRLKAARKLVAKSARGSSFEKVVRGVFFVFNGRIIFCCTTDNLETKNVLFSCFLKLPTNLDEPRCEIPLQAVIDWVDSGLFNVMPLKPHTGNRGPEMCVTELYVPNLLTQSEILGELVQCTRSPRYRDDDDYYFKNEELFGVKRLCNRENEEPDFRFL
jgi:hypothetical protein